MTPMAMTTCRECKKEISSEAKTCPHCGVSAPGRRGVNISTPAGCMIIILLLVVVFYFIGKNADTPPPAHRRISQADRRFRPALS
jgi:ABC-type ATPase with predicted acetyltransferase domain